MSNLNSNLIENDQIRTNQFRERFNYFVNNLNEKIVEVTNTKNYFTNYHQNLQQQLNNHFENVLHNKILEKKRVIELEIDDEYNQLFDKFEKSVEQANYLKQKIKSEIESFEALVNSLNNCEKHENNNQFQDSEDFSENDMLMINESTNEFSNENETTSRPSKNEIKIELERIFTNIESLMNQSITLNNILNDLKNGFVSENSIKLVKCIPDLTNICFGHIRKSYKKDMLTDNNQELQTESVLIHPVELLDHTSFKLETNLSENFSFKKFEKCHIKFSCVDFTKKKDNQTISLHDYLKIDLYDSQNNSVPFDLQEKLVSNQRFIRILFIPQVSGIFKLSAKYKKIDIPNGPFHFVVLNNQNSNTTPNLNITSSGSCYSIVSNSFESTKNDNDIFKIPQLPVEQEENNYACQSLQSKTSNIPQGLGLGSQTLRAGRGRLLRLSDNNKSVTSGQNVSLTTSVSQKRKTPNPTCDTNNNIVYSVDEEMEAEEETSMREISSKLKKIVCVDENLINNDKNSSVQSIRALMSLNVNTNSININYLNTSNQENSIRSGLNILSNHLKKYNNTNGLVRLIDDKPIPPLKAEFQRKYSDCSFPIGVRSCKIRNWVVVCDNGNDTVKIFEKTTGELLHRIVGDSSQNYSFKRPSAVLISDDNSEIYVKDDIEIKVFDLEQNFKLVRRFGQNVLRKPFGLAYDMNKNLIVVDADYKTPTIYTFDRFSGQVLNKKPYQPAIKEYANSRVLTEAFGGTRVLSNKLQPFEKTKIRFLCSNQNSIYACDLGRSIVYKTNLNGEIELAFGFFGRRHAEFNEPSGIHVDNDGMAILVGDSKNDRIQIYDQNGKYKCDIEFCGEKCVRPSDIHVDNEGYLYVSCFLQQCVKKYKLIKE